MMDRKSVYYIVPAALGQTGHNRQAYNHVQCRLVEHIRFKVH